LKIELVDEQVPPLTVGNQEQQQSFVVIVVVVVVEVGFDAGEVTAVVYGHGITQVVAIAR
jgi:hypothetical protein